MKSLIFLSVTLLIVAAFPVLGKGIDMSSITALTFSLDSKILAGGVTDGRRNSLQLWEVESQTLLADVGVPQPIHSLAFSPDGSLLAIGCHPCIIFDVASGQPITTLKGDTRVVAFSPDGTQLVRVTWPQTSIIQFWDIHKGREVNRLSTEGKYISTNIAFSPDGRQVAAGAGAWGRAFIWDLETSAMVTTFVPTGYVKSVAFSDDGRFLVSGGVVPATHSVLLWHIATGAEVARLFAHTDGVNLVAFFLDGKRLISVGRTLAVVWDMERKVKIAHLSTVEEQPLINNAFFTKPIAVSPDGRWLANTVSGERVFFEGEIFLWELPTKSLSVSPNGRLLTCWSRLKQAK